jgi:fluoride exporter
MSRYVMIAIGGAIGAIARYQVAAVVQARVPVGFPYGTFVVNVSGCLIMGFATAVLTERLVVHPNWRFLIPIGFVGAYTTFSTFELETFRAASEGAWAIAGANVIASCVVGYVALWAGFMLARAIF